MSASRTAGHVIRSASPDDAGELSRLHAAAFRQAWDADTVCRFLHNPACVALVAEARCDDEISGFVIGRTAVDEAEVITLAVAPGKQGLGIGRALVSNLADRLRQQGIVRLFLEVNVENAAAIKVYRFLGFTEIGQRAGYYTAAGGSDAKDALVLQLSLTPAQR